MKPTQIACYSYPTSVIFLDDSERFLSKISLELDSRIAYLSLTDPHLAIEYIQKMHSPNRVIDKLLSENQEAYSYGLDPTEHDVKLNLGSLYHEIYNAERFNEPTVLVVDYSMPALNGLEVCRRLSNTSVKKIMLTGDADTSLAVEAFNEGLIDKFIIKKDANLGQKINTAILELQNKHFLDISHALLKNLNTQPNSCLKDPKFAEFFNEFCHSKKITEYYLINVSGSYLLLTENGSIEWFTVASDEDMDYYYEFAESEGASDEILSALKNRQKVPYFQRLYGYLEAKEIKWEEHLYDAKKIEGESTTFYYALITKPHLFEIKKDKIISFKHYLENNWPPI